MFVTYKLSEKSFKNLRKKGVSDVALNDLTELENRVFPNSYIFLSRVRKLPQAEEIMKNEADLLKGSKGVFAPGPSDSEPHNQGMDRGSDFCGCSGNHCPDLFVCTLSNSIRIDAADYSDWRPHICQYVFLWLTDSLHRYQTF